MAPIDALVFWQNIPSILQAPLQRSLAKRAEFEVVVVAESDVPPHRLGLGWYRPEFAPARVYVRPTVVEREELIKRYARSRTAHVFTGLSGFPTTYKTLKAVSRSPATLGLFLEPGRSDDGVRAWARLGRYRWHGLTWRHRASFVLATGEIGERYYARCGFSREQLYPFGYFVEPARIPSKGTERSFGATSTRKVQILFVGQLTSRKGVDILLRALAGMAGDAWHLRIVGDGVDSRQLRSMCTGLGLDEQVTWLGSMDNLATRALMARTDVLALPSRHDGWGAVVNEALHAGVRVLVSSACGASDLIRDARHGRVFLSGSPESLGTMLRQLVDLGPVESMERDRIAAWATTTLSPYVASEYLLRIIAHAQGNNQVRPVPPWRQTFGLTA